MRYLGYDYGTTNTLVSEYSSSSMPQTVVLDKRASATYDGDEYIRSPKRLMSGSAPYLKKAGGYLSRITEEVFDKVFPKGFRKEPFFLTVTVPNAFKDNQCKLMLDTVRDVCRQFFTEKALHSDTISIIPEPIAAALYYVYQRALECPESGLLVVCDIGGGTTDLAIVKYTIEGHDNKQIIFKVICTEGDDMLGGDDIDNLIVKDLVNRFLLDPSQYTEKTILAAAKALKRKLSVQETAEVVLTGPDGHNPAVDNEGIPILLTLSRNRLERLMNLPPASKTSFFGRFKRLANELKKDLQEKVDGVIEIDRLLEASCIVPIGGTSQIPSLRALMKECFRGEMFLLPGERGDESGEAPYDSVVRGAAIYSAWRNNALKGISDIVIEGRTLHRISICVNDNDLETIVEKNMPSQVYTPKQPLIPLKEADSQGMTFRIQGIDLYEGEGDFVGDDSSGAPPVHLDSIADKLGALDEIIFTHGDVLDNIHVIVSLDIYLGRLKSMSIHIPRGKENGEDYQKTIDFITK